MKQVDRMGSEPVAVPLILTVPELDASIRNTRKWRNRLFIGGLALVALAIGFDVANGNQDAHPHHQDQSAYDRSNNSSPFIPSGVDELIYGMELVGTLGIASAAVAEAAIISDQRLLRGLPAASPNTRLIA